MVVLIVDDQVTVVSGLFCGINWGKIGIDKIFKAYNSYEAKKIIKNNHIDILLSDIEMPTESGLDLCTWIRDNNYNTICILLTAHAEFMYAQKAVKLNVFDYILQPAAYSEIENVLTRAIRKLEETHTTEKIYSYGRIVYASKDKFFDAVFNPIFTANDYNAVNELVNVNKLGFNFSLDSSIYLSLLNFDDINKYPRQKIVDTMQSCLSPVNQDFIFFNLKGKEFGCITFGEQDTLIIPYDMYLEQLRVFVQEITGKLNLNVAIYTCNQTKFKDIARTANRITAYRQNMLDNSFGLFDIDKPVSIHTCSSLPNMKLWLTMLHDNHPEIMITESESFFKNIPSDINGAEKLKKFYQEFIQFISVLLTERNTSINDLFDDKGALDTVLSSYKSADAMKKLVLYFYEYFQNEMNKTEDPSFLEKVTEYIDDNISEDLRREDIASYMHLNPSYLSRIFKKENGMSLKEYIIEKKMDLAQTLLKSTNLTISMIAIKTGYTNFSLFSQTYRKVKGKLPSEERKQLPSSF